MTSFEIHKAGGILIRDRKLLVERSKGKTFFIAPGGSIEPGETAKQALIRELLEEFQVTVHQDNLEEFGTFYAKAAEQEEKRVRMDVFLIKSWSGEIVPDNEVEEIRWIDSQNSEGIKLGSIFEHDVIPRLKEQGLIDF